MCDSEKGHGEDSDAVPRHSPRHYLSSAYCVLDTGVVTGNTIAARTVGEMGSDYLIISTLSIYNYQLRYMLSRGGPRLHKHL